MTSEAKVKSSSSSLEAKPSAEVTEHLLSFEELKQRYNIDFNSANPLQSAGLPSSRVAGLLEEYGPNLLTPPKKVHPFIAYLGFLTAVFNIRLIFCGVLEWILLVFPGNIQNSYIGAILIAVAFINAYIEFYQHQKSAALLESFLNMIPSNCTAIRDGAITNMSVAGLVPGDVIAVRMGDKIPADFYVFNSVDFKVDNSSLTGESEPQERFNQNTQQNPLEATNLAFAGTLAVSGEAYGVVIRTADQTVLGQIANLTQGESKQGSPLSQEIERFVFIISILAFLSGGIFFVAAMFQHSSVAIGQRLSYSFNLAVCVLIAWIPQGLPATVSMLLTFAAQRMAKKQVLVKSLQGVETLGAITMLATDKTGTLTRNQMTVTNVWCSMKLLAANAYDEKALCNGEIMFDKQVSGAMEILYMSSMCARARYDRTDVPISERPVTGDATESGLLRFAGGKLGGEIDELAEKYPKVFEIPFNSENKWHMTIHKMAHPNGPLTQFMKGAPERVLRICSHILIDGVAVEMTQDHKDAFQRSYEYMAGKGHRVLAFAQRLLDGAAYSEEYVFDKKSRNYPSTDMCFVGLTSLEDPPKHGVREAIGHCRGAGIKVMMVTGDHPLTAEAIARKINLMLSDTKQTLSKKTGRPIESIRENEVFATVIHGERIDSLTEQEWDDIFAKDEIVFARTSPKHKLQIVKRAQSIGHIVGVTGDGVNDSPALKKADLGIAMNISGSDVSKEAAAMILLDDNFSSTVNGISEGRLIFTNLKKSIQYIVTHIIPEIVPFMLSVIVPIPVTLNAMQLLVIDLGFELFAALSYAFEPAENAKLLMKLPPRRPVTPQTIARIKTANAKKMADMEIEMAAASKETSEKDPESALVTSALPSGDSSLTLNNSKALLTRRTGRSSNGNKVAKWFRQVCTKEYWAEVFRPADGEVLVDQNLVSWAYLEVGVIELLGALTAYFVVLWAGKSTGSGSTPEGTPFRISPYDAWAMSKGQGIYLQTDGTSPNYTTVSGNVLDGQDQKEALAQCQSMYYLSIMLIQMFNLFACKCKNKIPFGPYLFANKYTFLSVLGGAGFAILIVYVPPFNVPFGTSYRLSPIFWLIPLAAGILMLIYASLRVVVRRHLHPTVFSKTISGLQMFPTRWSTTSSEKS